MNKIILVNEKDEIQEKADKQEELTEEEQLIYDNVIKMTTLKKLYIDDIILINYIKKYKHKIHNLSDNNILQ